MLDWIEGDVDIEDTVSESELELQVESDILLQEQEESQYEV